MAGSVAIMISSEIASTDSHFHSGGGGNNSFSALTVRYVPFGGWPGTSTTETDTKYRVRVAFTLSNLLTNVASNGITLATTVVLRKNGANGNNTISITASTTGFFEDTTHTDSIAIADEVNAQVSPGNGGTSIAFGVIGFMGLLPSGGVFTPNQLFVMQAINRSNTF